MLQGTIAMISVTTARMPRFLMVLCVILAVLGHSTVLQAGSRLNGFRLVQQENVMLHFDLDSAQMEDTDILAV